MTKQKAQGSQQPALAPAPDQSLSTWQRFKRWASRSFGCTSPQNVEITPQDNRRPISKKRKSKPDVQRADSEAVQKPKVQRTQSFSKDADKMQYIDESTANIPESVKKESSDI